MLTQEKLLEITGLKEIGADDFPRGAGVILGFPAEAVVSKDGKLLVLVFTTADTISTKIYKKLRNALWENETLKDYMSISNQEDDDVFNTFLINMDISDKVELHKLYDLTLKRLEEVLVDFPELTPPVGCNECKDTGSDTLAYQGAALTFIHMTCLEKQMEEIKQSFEEKSANPNLVGGLIGGFIGGIVAAIPALVALAFFDYFVGLLYALIPLGIFYGWKLAGGKIVKFTTIFTIVYTFIASGAVWFLSIAIALRSYLADWGFNITLTESLSYVFEFISESPDEFMDIFLMDSLLALGAAVVGIWIAWRQITRTDEQDLQNAQEAFEQTVSLDEPID